jgi:hypothetical protein
MSSPTAQKHPVAPNEQKVQDQNPVRDVDLTNDDTENVYPATTIPFLSSKMHNITIVYAMDTLPEDLRDVNASGWKNGAKLLELFKLPAGTVRGGKVCRIAERVPRMFPQCLLLDAKTLEDKMRVVNWWISLEKVEMREVTNHSGRFTVHPQNPTNFSIRECLRTRNTPRSKRLPSASTAGIPETFADNSVRYDNDGVSQGLATSVPTEDDSCDDGPGTETVFTALGSHVASVDPCIEDIFIEESLGPFNKEISAYEGNSTQVEIEECKAFLAAQMEVCKTFLAAQREERKTFLNSKIATKKAEFVQPNQAAGVQRENVCRHL